MKTRTEGVWQGLEEVITDLEKEQWSRGSRKGKVPGRKKGDTGSNAVGGRGGCQMR